MSSYVSPQQMRSEVNYAVQPQPQLTFSSSEPHTAVHVPLPSKEPRFPQRKKKCKPITSGHASACVDCAKFNVGAGLNERPTVRFILLHRRTRRSHLN